MNWIALNHLLEPAASTRLVSREPIMTHANWAQACLRLAAFLHVRRCRRVAVCFDDTIGLTQALMACWRAGATAVVVADAHAPEGRQHDAEVDLWLSDRTLDLPISRQHGPDAAADLAALPPGTLDLHQTGVVLATSGSSGLPKPVHRTWAQLERELHALESRWHWADTPSVTVLGSVIARHMYGLPFRGLWPLCAGRPIVSQPWNQPETLVQASLRHSPSCWITSPAMLKRLGVTIETPGLPQSVQAIFSAGGPLPDGIAVTLRERLGIAVTDIYGSSETGALAWRHTGSWRPLPGVQHSIDVRGALQVAAPWIEPPVQTDDSVTLDADGFTLLGRLDRVIKIEETRIALSAVERAIAQSPWVEEAVVGRKSTRTRLSALLALNESGVDFLRQHGRRALVLNLVEDLRQTVPSVAVPRQWRLVQAIGWNAQGKLPAADFDRLMHTKPEDADIESVAAHPGDTAAVRRYRLYIPLDLRVFAGHFPHVPIVPGVLQIGWAVKLAQRDLAPTLHCRAVHALKFQRLVRPGEIIDLTLSWDITKQRVRFQYDQNHDPVSSGQIQGDLPRS